MVIGRRFGYQFRSMKLSWTKVEWSFSKFFFVISLLDDVQYDSDNGIFYGLFMANTWVFVQLNGLETNHLYVYQGNLKVASGISDPRNFWHHSYLIPTLVMSATSQVFEVNYIRNIRPQSPQAPETLRDISDPWNLWHQRYPTHETLIHETCDIRDNWPMKLVTSEISVNLCEQRWMGVTGSVQRNGLGTNPFEAQPRCGTSYWGQKYNYDADALW